MIHKYSLFLMAIAFNFLAFSTQAWAQSPPIEIRTSTKNPIIEYKPFSGTTASQQFSLEFVVIPDFDENTTTPLRAEQERRLVSVRIRPSVLGPFSARGESSEIPITVSQKQRGGRFNYFDDEYRHDFYIKPFSGDVQSLDYLFNIAPSIFATAGDYTLPLYISVVDVETGEPLSDLLAMNVGVIVEPKLQVNVAGTQSQKRTKSGSRMPSIDFGELESGESRRVFVQVRGNAPALITVSSENKGTLQAPDDPDMKVNYSIRLDNEPSSLNAPLTIHRPVAPNLRGSSYPMVVTVGDVAGAFSGAYQDIIMIEVRPQ